MGGMHRTPARSLRRRASNARMQGFKCAHLKASDRFGLVFRGNGGYVNANEIVREMKLKYQAAAGKGASH